MPQGPTRRARPGCCPSEGASGFSAGSWRCLQTGHRVLLGLKCVDSHFARIRCFRITSWTGQADPHHDPERVFRNIGDEGCGGKCELFVCLLLLDLRLVYPRMVCADCEGPHPPEYLGGVPFTFRPAEHCGGNSASSASGPATNLPPLPSKAPPPHYWRTTSPMAAAWESQPPSSAPQPKARPSGGGGWGNLSVKQL